MNKHKDWKKWKAVTEAILSKEEVDYIAFFVKKIIGQNIEVWSYIKLIFLDEISDTCTDTRELANLLRKRIDTDYYSDQLEEHGINPPSLGRLF